MRLFFNKLAVLFLLIVLILGVFANIIANNKPLIVKYNNTYYFPIFSQNIYTEHNLFNNNINIPVDYKNNDVQKHIKQNGFIVFPVLSYSYNTQSTEYTYIKLQPPSKKHYLGTNSSGFSIIAMLIYSAESLVFIIVPLTFASVLLSFILGSLAGFYLGFTDSVIRKIYTVIILTPIIYLVLYLQSTVANLNYFWLLLATNWVVLFASVRSSVIRIKQFSYVQHLKLMGYKSYKIIIKHILPEVFLQLRSFIPLLAIINILSVVGFEFLGVGNTSIVAKPNLGILLKEVSYNLDSWHLVIPVLGFLFLILISLISFCYAKRL